MDNTSHHRNIHAYKPLPGPDHIRLLSLNPALQTGDPLHFSFVTAELLEVEAQYEALSYTWGEPILAYPLYVDGTRVLVTANLDQALRRLRLPATPRILWADAACIDQSNDAEKGTQIPLMTQIFRGAQRVLAWVGGGQEEEQGMKELGMLSRQTRHAVCMQIRHGVENVSPRWSMSTVDNIRQFLHLPWFSRLWVIQEIVFNNDVNLICGSSELSWSRLFSALLIIRQTRPEAIVAFGSVKVEALLKIMQLWKYHCVLDPPSTNPKNERSENILDLVDRFWAYKCSDPRDRIYALYSMTSDIASKDPPRAEELRTRISMDVNYSLTLVQTYVALATACIDSGQLADVLNAVFARQSQHIPENWPSWVPDWRKPPLKNCIKLYPNLAGPFRTSPGSLSMSLSTLALDVRVDALEEIVKVDQKLLTSDTQSPESLLFLLRDLIKTFPKLVLADLLWVVLGFPMAIDACDRWGQPKSFDARDICESFIEEVASSCPLSGPRKLGELCPRYPGLIERVSQHLQTQCLFIAKTSLHTCGEKSTSIGFGSAALEIGDEFCGFCKVREITARDDASRRLFPSYRFPPGGHKALILRATSPPYESDNSTVRYHRLVGSAYISPPCKDGKAFKIMPAEQRAVSAESRRIFVV